MLGDMRAVTAAQPPARVGMRQMRAGELGVSDQTTVPGRVVGSGPVLPWLVLCAPLLTASKRPLRLSSDRAHCAQTPRSRPDLPEIGQPRQPSLRPSQKSRFGQADWQIVKHKLGSSIPAGRIPDPVAPPTIRTGSAGPVLA